jgi:hypothetical protein
MTLSLDQIGVILGAILTLFILSYLIGDNFLYRLAVHILIGVSAAYITVTVIADVLWPRLVMPILAQSASRPADVIAAGIGLILSLMLLFKALPRWAWVGNVPVGYLVGVGAAVALGGALFGTLGTQVAAMALPPGAAFKGPNSDVNINFFLNIIIVFGTVTTLLSFSFFRAARRGVLSGLSSIGRTFLAIALGATFALVYIASVTVLIDRVQAISDAVLILFAR